MSVVSYKCYMLFMSCIYRVFRGVYVPCVSCVLGSSVWGRNSSSVYVLLQATANVRRNSWVVWSTFRSLCQGISGDDRFTLWPQYRSDAHTLTDTFIKFTKLSVREYVFYVFFSDFKKNRTFYVFFEMTFQKNVKSHTKSIRFAECL